AVDARTTRVYRRDREMRILIGVAMTGKMFSRGDHPVLLQAVNHSLAHVSNEMWILAERTHPDDGIRRIVVDVEHWRERHVHAERASFDRCNAAELVGERRIACGAEAHLIWEHRGAAEIDVVRQEVATALAERRPCLVV